MMGRQVVLAARALWAQMQDTVQRGYRGPSRENEVCHCKDLQLFLSETESYGKVLCGRKTSDITFRRITTVAVLKIGCGTRAEAGD